MEEGFFSRLMQSRARGYAPDETAAPSPPGAATKLGAAALDLGGISSMPAQFLAGAGSYPDAVSSTPAYDALVRRPAGETRPAVPGAAQRLGAAAADVAMTPFRALQSLGNFLDPVEVPAVQSWTPAYDTIRRMPGYNRPADAAPANTAGFGGSDQIPNLPTSNDLRALMIRPIGGEARQAAPAAQAARPALPSGISMSPYDMREDNTYRPVRVIRGDQATDYSVRTESTVPAAQRPDYERLIGPDGQPQLFFRDRTNPDNPVLRRVYTPAEQTALASQALESLVKQQGIRKTAAEEAQARANAQKLLSDANLPERTGQLLMIDAILKAAKALPENQQAEYIRQNTAVFAGDKNPLNTMIAAEFQRQQQQRQGVK